VLELPPGLLFALVAEQIAISVASAGIEISLGSQSETHFLPYEIE
jgi:hypothetical protein